MLRLAQAFLSGLHLIIQAYLLPGLLVYIQLLLLLREVVLALAFA
jgi:hypothetical protein